jgi:hypothetical protein
MKRKAIATKHLVALLALMGAVPLTRAQYREWIEQPENYDWYAVPRVQYLRTDVEAEQDKMQSSGSTANQDTSRVYVSPRIGIAWDNYLYHPYLLTYSMLFEPGYVWQNRTSNGKTTETDELVLDGTFRANVLQIKPYATTLSYSHSHEEAKYGFFSTATVDSQSWGATSGYRDGPVPVEVSSTFTRTMIARAITPRYWTINSPNSTVPPKAWVTISPPRAPTTTHPSRTWSTLTTANCNLPPASIPWARARPRPPT